jgi:hypothetical protein
MFYVIKFECQEPQQIFGNQNSESPVCTADVLQKIYILLWSIWIAAVAKIHWTHSITSFWKQQAWPSK